jgi:hypothetical protein
MIGCRTRVAAAALVAVLVAAAPCAAQPAARPLDADHARLSAMVGTWDVEMTLWPRPGGAGLTAKGGSTIRPLFDGLFVEERIEGTLNGAAFTTLAWTGFNPSTHQYEATRISGSNPGRIAESGAWDERTKQLELAGDYVLAGSTWHQRTVIQMPSPDTMSATSYLSFGTVPEWKAVQITYTRKAR